MTPVRLLRIPIPDVVRPLMANRTLQSGVLNYPQSIGANEAGI
jgi:hypothetical protein